MVNQCRHIRTSGTQCGMAAMRSRNFCYYHQNCQPRPHRPAVRTRPHTQTPIQTYDYGAIPVASRDAGAPGPASGTWENASLPVYAAFATGTWISVTYDSSSCRTGIEILRYSSRIGPATW